MIQQSFATASRFCVILTGMIKIGYCLMVLSTYYFYNYDHFTQSYNNCYYKNIGAFLGGMYLNLFLQKTYSRYYLIVLNEFIFSVLMIVIPLTNSDVRLYGYLIGGGVSLILYPIYAREHFLKDQFIKLMITLWFFLCLGIVYFYLIQSIDFDIIEGNPLILTDNITCYVFGSISIINIILLSIQKQKETPFYYSQSQNGDEHLNQLIQQIYKPEYQQNVLKGFQYKGVHLYNMPLLNDIRISTDENVFLEDCNKYQIITIFFLALCAGCSYVFLIILWNLNSFLYLINQDQFVIDFNMLQYYLYLLIILPNIVLGCLILKSKRRKQLIIFAFIISFIFNIIQLIQIEQNSGSISYFYFILANSIVQFGCIAPAVFTLPFLFLKINKIVVYFSLFWIGSVFQKIFLRFSGLDTQTNYNPQILIVITLFIGVISLFKIKNL